MSSKKIIPVLIALICGVTGVIVGTTINANKPAGNDVTGPTVAASTQAPTVSQTETTTETTTQPTTESTTVASAAQQIIGKWSDSTKMSGYEFFSDGKVVMTYVNLTVPFINMPIEGTSTGTYTIHGNTLTTKFSIYSATIENTYTVSIENDVLSMYDTEDKETATYTRDTDTQQTTTEPISQVDELIGGWVKNDGSAVYVFAADGSFILEKGGVQQTGIYLCQGKNVIIQYNDGTQNVTLQYQFTVTKNSMILSNSAEKLSFTRQGTGQNGGGSVNEGIIGKWSDSSKMSSYEFKEGGVVVITYMNFTVPVINMKISDSFDGTYTVKGDTLTVSYSVYQTSLSDTYEFEINGDVLTLYTVDGKMLTYIREN